MSSLPPPNYEEDVKVLSQVERDFEDVDKTADGIFRLVMGCGRVPPDFFDTCSKGFKNSLDKTALKILLTDYPAGGIFSFIDFAPKETIRAFIREVRAYSVAVAATNIASGAYKRILSDDPASSRQAKEASS